LMSTLGILQALSLKNDYTLLASPGLNDLITTEDSDRITLVHSYIRENVPNNIKLTDIAPIVGLTKESFCRYFKKKHRKNFITFLNEYKVALASKLLIETDLSISEIGYECGYNSISFFHRQFSRFMNMSPKEYRTSYTSI
ncbi:MAG: AraC family transcriptional regulator, partial [Puia sp.]